jgi:hypothetical protein
LPAQGNRGWRFFEADELAKLGDPRNLVGERAVGWQWQFTFHELGIIGKADQVRKRERCVYKEEGSSSCPNSLRDVE